MTLLARQVERARLPARGVPAPRNARGLLLASLSHVKMTGGGEICGVCLPPEVWHRLAAAVAEISVADLLSFRGVCHASSDGVKLVSLERQAVIRAQFSARTFRLDPDLVDRTLLVHVVPPHGESLLAIAECSLGGQDEPNVAEADGEEGLQLVWIRGEHVVRKALLVPDLPAPSSVSNVKFAPDGGHVAMLVTVDSGNAWMGEDDPIGRLAGHGPDDGGGMLAEHKYFEPSDECALVVAELQTDEAGMPRDIQLFVFAHAFVPEYGFDMLWRKSPRGAADASPELAFAGVLHAHGAVTLYVARWRLYATSPEGAFQCIGCLPHLAQELVEDKRDAMRTLESTRVTSRIEMSHDLKSIFFDSATKFGVVTIDRLEQGEQNCRLLPGVALHHAAAISAPFRDPRRASMDLPGRTRRSLRPAPAAWASKSPQSDGDLERPAGRSCGGRRPSLRDKLPRSRWISVRTEAKVRRQRSTAGRPSSCAGDARASSPNRGLAGPGVASVRRRPTRRREPVGIAESSASCIPWRSAESEARSAGFAVDGHDDCGDGDDVDGRGSADSAPPGAARYATDHRRRPDDGRSLNERLWAYCSRRRTLNFESDSGGRRTKSSDTAATEMLQSPPQCGTSTPPTGIHSIGTPEGLGTTTPVMTIQSPPQVSRPAPPGRPSRSHRIAFSKSSFTSTSPRVTCMSPDGKKLCSVYIAKLAASPGQPPAHMKCVEVRSTSDGAVLFRNCTTCLTEYPSAARSVRVRFERSHEIVANTCGFSEDSSILWVRDAWISGHLCIFTRRLPSVFRVSDGAVLRTFSEDDSHHLHLQVAPDGLALYATRYAGDGESGTVHVDAFDMLSGLVVGSEAVAGPMACPDVFNSQAVYLIRPAEVRGLSRGCVDALWESTRGSIGCRWSTRPPL
jgi:hypothetical protein